MKVVIDTSVLVSAAFRDRTPEEVILFVNGYLFPTTESLLAM